MGLFYSVMHFNNISDKTHSFHGVQICTIFTLLRRISNDFIYGISVDQFYGLLMVLNVFVGYKNYLIIICISLLDSFIYIT